MNVSQNVHGHILKLSQELSAGNGDKFEDGSLKKSEKVAILTIF